MKQTNAIFINEKLIFFFIKGEINNIPSTADKIIPLLKEINAAKEPIIKVTRLSLKNLSLFNTFIVIYGIKYTKLFI